MRKDAKTIGLSRHQTLRHTAVKNTTRTVCGRDFAFGNIRLTNEHFPEATCNKCKGAN